jgi:hypothetical protein
MRDWADAPRNGDGTYNGPALVAYYVAKLGGTDLDLNKEKARLTKEQADRTALANAISRGDVIPSSVAVQQWTDHVIAARAKLLSMPTKVGPQLVHATDVNVIAAVLKAAVYESLDELARWSPSEGAVEVDAPAGPDGEPVGGSGTETKRRVKRRAGTVED